MQAHNTAGGGSILAGAEGGEASFHTSVSTPTHKFHQGMEYAAKRKFSLSSRCQEERMDLGRLSNSSSGGGNGFPRTRPAFSQAANGEAATGRVAAPANDAFAQSAPGSLPGDPAERLTQSQAGGAVSPFPTAPGALADEHVQPSAGTLLRVRTAANTEAFTGNGHREMAEAAGAPGLALHRPCCSLSIEGGLFLRGQY